MKNFKTKFAAVLSILFLCVTILNLTPTEVNAKTASKIPKLSITTNTVKEYKHGSNIAATVVSSNYSSKVQYRAYLTNTSTKKKTEVWPSSKSGNYYTGKYPLGNQKFTVQYPAKSLTPGTYTMTILVRRYGTKVAYDSLVTTKAFAVKAAAPASPATLPTLTTSQIVKAYDNSVVLIAAFDSQNEVIAFGSGIAIGNGLFITNQHVLDVEGVKSYKILTNNKKLYEVDGIVKEDVNRDLAIIKSKQLFTVTPAKIGSYKSVSKGQKIVTIGNPEGLQNTVSEGIVSGIHYFKEDNVNIIQITAPITHGSSGGALFNTKGQVIGVTTMGLEEGNLNFAVAVDHAQSWINELKGKEFSKIAVIKKYIDSSLNTPTNPGGGNTPAPTAPSSSATLGSSSYIMDLNLQVTDSVMDTGKPIIYITDRVNKKLYSVNYETKEVKQVSFSLAPESIAYAKGKLYVSLLKQEHNAYVFDGQQKGAFAIVESSTLKILDTVDIDIDPFDIVADNEGYIYITSGSGQWTNTKSYDVITRQEVAAYGVRQASYAEYNSILNKIYFIDTDTSPRDISAAVLDKGKYTTAYDSPYHGDYGMSEKIKVSANGQYIFNGSGNIFSSTPMRQDDMKFVVKLNRGFKDVTFNGDSQFYTTNGEKIVYAYNHSSFKEIDKYTTNGVPQTLFFRNNAVVSISRVTKSGNISGFAIEKIKVGEDTNTGGNTTGTDTTGTSFSAPAVEFLMNLDFQITDIEKDTKNPIIYAIDRASKKLYKANYATKQVTSISFSLPPECLTYANGKVYVGLLKQEHTSYPYDSPQKGAFAIIDAEAMKVSKVVDIDLDPYDIAADKDGYIYISSGSGQWTKMKSYNGETGEFVAATESVYERSLLIYNPSQNRMYIANGELEAIGVNQGSFGNKILSQYRDLSSTAFRKKYTANGNYLFNGTGLVQISSEDKTEDMKLITKLNRGYIDIAFDNENRFYTSQETGRIYVYDYASLKGIDSFSVGGAAQYLYYDNGKLIAIMKTRKFEGSEIYNYKIQSINLN